MKIRTDFVTNSSSSSFITYVIREKNVSEKDKQEYKQFEAFYQELIDKYGWKEIHDTYGTLAGEDMSECIEATLCLRGEISDRCTKYLVDQAVKDAEDVKEMDNEELEEELEEYEIDDVSNMSKEEKVRLLVENRLFEEMGDVPSYKVESAFDDSMLPMDKLIAMGLGQNMTSDEKKILHQLTETLKPYITTYEYAGGTD